MSLTGAGGAPDADLRLALAQDQGLETGNDQSRLIGYEIVKAELAIQGKR